LENKYQATSWRTQSTLKRQLKWKRNDKEPGLNSVTQITRQAISWEDSHWSSLIIAKQTINSSNSLIWLDPGCERPKADRKRAGWKQRWRRICQIFGLDSPKRAYQQKKCKTLEIVEPTKRRCIDSAFKVIKPKDQASWLTKGEERRAWWKTTQPHQNPGNREEEASGKNLEDPT
jgi:hypothetical protein